MRMVVTQANHDDIPVDADGDVLNVVTVTEAIVMELATLGLGCYCLVVLVSMMAILLMTVAMCDCIDFSDSV